MSHERPRYIVERRSGTAWAFLGAHWTTHQWVAHLESLRGRGWHVRVLHEQPGRPPLEVVDLSPGDQWGGSGWNDKVWT